MAGFLREPPHADECGLRPQAKMLKGLRGREPRGHATFCLWVLLARLLLRAGLPDHRQKYDRVGNFQAISSLSGYDVRTACLKLSRDFHLHTCNVAKEGRYSTRDTTAPGEAEISKMTLWNRANSHKISPLLSTFDGCLMVWGGGYHATLIMVFRILSVQPRNVLAVATSGHPYDLFIMPG